MVKHKTAVIKHVPLGMGRIRRIHFVGIGGAGMGGIAEVLINLDADGIARIFRAEESANSEETLNSIFGDSSWKKLPGKETPFHVLCRDVLDLYKTRLRSLPNIRFVFAFEMQTTVGVLNYFLVFASQHPLGLEKMKESMKSIDQDGNYRFSDGSLNQSSLFRFNDPALYIPSLLHRFEGKTVQLEVKTDPRLIGGFLLQPGDNLFDASVKHDLHFIKKEFIENLYKMKI